MRFEALVQHREGDAGSVQDEEMKVSNPDEIVIDDDEELDDSAVEKVVIEQNSKAKAGKGDEIVLDDEEAEVTSPLTPVVHIGPPATKFLALDKCLPRRQFLEV